MSDRIAGRPVNRVSSETRIVDGRTVGRMYTKWVSDLSHEDLEKCEAFGVKMMAAMHAKLRRRREALGRTLTNREE